MRYSQTGFPWAEYLATRVERTEESERGDSRDKWTEDQRQARREDQRTRRQEEARQQRADEVEAEIHRLEAQLEALQQEIALASEAQQGMRLHELGSLYGELQGHLQEQIDLWAELAG